MNFTLKFDMDNAAFDDDVVCEFDRVLDRLKKSFRATYNSEPGSLLSGNVRDTNGNTIGEWTLEP